MSCRNHTCACYRGIYWDVVLICCFFFKYQNKPFFFCFFFGKFSIKRQINLFFRWFIINQNPVFSSYTTQWNSHNSRFAWWKNNFSIDFHQPVSETSWNIQKMHPFFFIKKISECCTFGNKKFINKMMFFFVPNINNRSKKLFFLQLNINNSVFFSTNYLWLIQHLNKFHGSQW